MDDILTINRVSSTVKKLLPCAVAVLLFLGRFVRLIKHQHSGAEGNIRPLSLWPNTFQPMSSVSSFEFVDTPRPVDMIPETPMQFSSSLDSAKAPEPMTAPRLQDAPKKQDPEFYMQDGMIVFTVSDLS